MNLLAWAAALAVTLPAPWQGQWRYARHLLEQGDPWRATTEFERLRRWGGDAAALPATVGLLRARWGLGELERAYRHARELSDHTPAALPWLWATAHAAGFATTAHRAWERGMAHGDAGLVARMWTARGFAAMAAGELAAAHRAFRRAAALPASDPVVLAARKWATATTRPPPTDPRTPSLALGLGLLLPGAGQLYAGAPAEAVGALVLTLGLGYGAWHSYRSGGRFEYWLLPAVGIHLGAAFRGATILERRRLVRLHARARDLYERWRPQAVILGIPIRPPRRRP